MNDNDSPSTRGAPALRGVDTDKALARFAGNAQRLQHWLRDFQSYGPLTAREIRAAISAGERERATKLAHAFKGRSGMLEMAELHSIALSLEMTLRNHEPTELWLEELERTVDEMSQQIAIVLGAAPTLDNDNHEEYA